MGLQDGEAAIEAVDVGDDVHVVVDEGETDGAGARMTHCTPGIQPRGWEGGVKLLPV